MNTRDIPVEHLFAKILNFERPRKEMLILIITTKIGDLDNFL
jgi:hypothetical protein